MRRLLILPILLFALAGCESLNLDGARQTVDILAADVATAQAAHEAYRAEIEALRAEIEALPDGPAKDQAEAVHAGYVEGLDAVSAQLAIAVPALEALQERLAASDDPLDAAAATIETVAPMFGPWGGLAGGFALAALGLWRAARTKQVSLRTLRAADPVVNPTPEQARRMSAEMGAAGKRLVDEAEGKVSGLPF